MNFTNVRTAILGLLGVTVMLTSWTVVTVSPVDPLTEFSTAPMVVAPAATLVTSPCALIVAAVGFDELQRTVPVTS